jgi:hypothetical protein
MNRAGIQRRWRTRKIANPAAGADWTFKAPGGFYWRITSIVARLVTSAAVANRVLTLRAGDQTNFWYAQETPLAVPQNTTVDFCAHTGGGGTSGTALTLVLALPSEGLLLLPGNQLVSVTTAIDVADQWSDVIAMLDEIPSDDIYASTEGAQVATT